MPDLSPRLPFEIAEAVDPSLVTGRAGVPLVIELFRQLGVAAMVDAEVAVKRRQCNLPPSQLIESLIALWASGRERKPPSAPPARPMTKGNTAWRPSPADREPLSASTRWPSRATVSKPGTAMPGPRAAAGP